MKAQRTLTKVFMTSFVRLLERIFERQLLDPTEFAKVKDQIQRILIISHHKQAGDLLLATPVLRAIGKHYPDAYITVAVHSTTSPLLLNNLNIDEIIDVPTPGDDSFFRKLFYVFKKVRNFDLVILLNTDSHSMMSDFTAYLSGAKWVLASKRLLLEDCTQNFVYNLAAPFSEGRRHETSHALDVVRYIEIHSDDFSEEIYLTSSERKRATDFLKTHGIRPDDFILGLNICSNVAQILWPVARFASIMNYFSVNHHAKIIVSWHSEHDSLRNELLNSLPFIPVETTNLSDRELAAVLYYCNLVICNESDFMHLAASVGTPLISVFGTENLDLRKPHGEQYIALKDIMDEYTEINEELVIAHAEALIEAHPKALRLDFEDLDISEQVLSNYEPLLEVIDE